VKRSIALLVGSSLCLSLFAKADDLVFTTLPQPVQTTVIRETHISGPTAVTRIIRDESGVYAVTVHQDSGDRVVYVNDAGAIVQAPAAGTTTTTTTTGATGTTVQRTETVQPSSETVVTTDQVQQNVSRYQLLEKKGKKEIYLDRQTGQKVTVKRED
jgi:hypothetical protein